MVRHRVCAELDLTFVGLRPAGYQIEERGFAGPVWADDHPEFTLGQVEIEIRDGLEAIVSLGDILHGEQGAGHGQALAAAALSTGAGARNFFQALPRRSGRLTKPPGRKSTTRMKRPPRMTSQRSG